MRRCRIGALFLALAFLHGASVGTALAQNAAETAFWNRVRDSTNANELRAYLEAYPNGAFADAARARLDAIAAEGNGFALAEVDLTIRGEGEILGTRQHGLPRFRAASLPEDTALLIEARRRVLELRDRFGSLEAPGVAPLLDEARRRFGDERVEQLAA